MKKILICALALMLALMPVFAAAEIELFAVTVGKGDAIFVRSGDYTCLIDTGKADAEENIRRAMEQLQIDALDAVFITHADKDHTGGLKWLRKSELPIGAIYASAYHPEVKEEKHPAVKTAEKLGLEVVWLKAGDRVPLGDSGAEFFVLAPETEIPENEDDNSLVMLLSSPDGRALFAGDMETVEEAALLASAQDISCDLLKAANHGDTDANSLALLKACAPKVTIISTDSSEKTDTPDPRLLKNLESIHSAAFITEDCTGGIRVRLLEGEVMAEYVNW